MENFMLFTSEFEQSDELYFDNTPVLKYSVIYPQFSAVGVSLFAGRLNTYYKSKADLLVELCKTTYYREAVLSYQTSNEMGYPFHEHEFYSDYTITNNRDCVLSLYMDESSYTGGANGSKKQTSDNWNLKSECFLSLEDLFAGSMDYQEIILHEINLQISWQISHNEGNYFVDYVSRTKEFFSAQNFYITRKSLEFYYQEMTIAPHSSGIVTFSIPFVSGPSYPRVCDANNV